MKIYPSMKRNLLIFFALLLAVPALAQRYRNPSQYYRQFSNQNRKLTQKTNIFLTNLLMGEDARRVTRYREMVEEQAKDSKQEVSRTGPYEDYETLQREYEKGLEEYHKAFSKHFTKALNYYPNRFASYDSLTTYYDWLTKAENAMYDARYTLESAEDHFAKTYYVDQNPDEELAEESLTLDRVSIYLKDMDLAFFNVERAVQNWVNAIDEQKRDTLHTLVAQIRKSVRASADSIKPYTDYEGDDDLFEEVEYYITEVNEEIDENLRPLSDAFANAYLDPKEYADAEKDLNRVKDWLQDAREDYFDTRQDVTEGYFED